MKLDEFDELFEERITAIIDAYAEDDELPAMNSTVSMHEIAVVCRNARSLLLFNF